MADGNSVGVLNDEDTASRLSEGVSSLIPAEPASASASTTSKAGKRPMKLRNKVYFQLLEATNALQREEAGKSDGGAKPVKLSSAQVARLAQIALETQPEDAKAVEASRALLGEFVPLVGRCVESRFVQYISQIQSILRQTLWRVCGTNKGIPGSFLTHIERLAATHLQHRLAIRRGRIAPRIAFRHDGEGGSHRSNRPNRANRTDRPNRSNVSNRTHISNGPNRTHRSNRSNGPCGPCGIDGSRGGGGRDRGGSHPVRGSMQGIEV